MGHGPTWAPLLSREGRDQTCQAVPAGCFRWLHLTLRIAERAVVRQSLLLFTLAVWLLDIIGVI